MGRRRRNVYIFAPKRKTHPFRNLTLWLLTLMFLACIAVFILNLASNNQVEYLTQRVTVENLPGDLESFSILHLSDLHAAQLGPDGSRAEKGDYAEKRFLHCSVWGYGGEERRCGPLAAAAGHDAPGRIGIPHCRGQRSAAAESGSPREHLSLCGLAAGGGGTRGHLPG